ncbi:MAG TPA: hypothetical protein VM554_14390 [Acidisarcina sp.]|nr:hypothetical protein [Acidisarcina sp.]
MTREPLEVSARFGQIILARVLELELGAARDEQMIPTLLSEDHKMRQRRLVREQRAEAGRMRDFLKDARIRQPRRPQEV